MTPRCEYISIRIVGQSRVSLFWSRPYSVALDTRAKGTCVKGHVRSAYSYAYRHLRDCSHISPPNEPQRPFWEVGGVYSSILQSRTNNLVLKNQNYNLTFYFSFFLDSEFLGLFTPQNSKCFLTRICIQVFISIFILFYFFYLFFWWRIFAFI